MIIVKLKGGLGNQLFQYAFGRLLSIKNNAPVEYYFEETQKGDAQRSYKLKAFNVKLDIASTDTVKKIEYPFGAISKIVRKAWRKISNEHNIGYVPAMINKTNGYFDGYWQSYKYLEPIKNALLAEISLKNPIENKYSDIVKNMREKNSVSVHIRRGDYASDSKTKSVWQTFGLEYYEHAFQIIKNEVQNPTLFVFSDDIGWAKENLKSDMPMTFVSQPGMQDFEELILMSKCKHNIIANSSFSFWGAWLNQNPSKIIIAPKKWNNVQQKEYRDLLPQEWIKI